METKKREQKYVKNENLQSNSLQKPLEASNNEVLNLNKTNSTSITSDKSDCKNNHKKIQCIQTVMTSEQLNELRRHAQEAIKQNKIFSVRGCFQSIRNALKIRGWVEKIEHHQRKQIITSNHHGQVSIMDLSLALPKRKTGETRRQFLAKCERNIMSRFVEHLPVDFLWTDRKDKMDYAEQSRNPQMLINKFTRTPFTNKEGLNGLLRDLSWFFVDDIAEVNFPRCFNVWNLEELNEFIEHFKLTACVSFLRWLVDKYRENGYGRIFSDDGKIPFTAIEFALKRCHEYCESALHDDIDGEDPPRIWEHDWDTFLSQHYQLTHESYKIQAEAQRAPIETMVRSISQVLDALRDHWPQYTIDGYQNLWIVKPANKCRGRGIHLGNNLKKILNIVNPSVATKSRYVIQKYIERPLIIHQTKFDIRQWFLISNIHPLVVWMYKECYLRFSSQEYSLVNHHESVHLTNYAIQKKYTNHNKRDKRLPNENMWDSYSFQAYLRQIGKQNLWEERIYPSMRKAIVATILVAQDHMERTPNTFELFGADFMICENFYPWLIEINSSPDLAPTTSVTARMCPQCLEDVIKVIVDRRGDPKADVGNFELIYRQIVPPTPAYMGLNLCVKGKQLTGRAIHSQHYGLQRKERSLHTSNLYRQRTSLALSSISHLHKPMPAFNATDYIERCLIQTSNTSRSSSIPSLLSNNTDQPNLYDVSPHNTIKRKKTYNITVTCSNAMLNKSSHAKLKAQLNSTLKRHRSCVPRLTTALTNATQSHKIKFSASNVNRRKTIDIKNSKALNHLNGSTLDAPILMISRSADNIKELCSPNKTLTKMSPSKSLSPVISRRNSPIKSAKAKDKTRQSSKNFKSMASNEKEKIHNSDIHAVGKSIISWNSKRNHSLIKTPPPPPTLHISPRYLTANYTSLATHSN
uniref:Tubulin glycylase 3A n=1 Tax=Glossina austeni TaxID=7395 RepID=A0A1A9VF55_GLOAU